MIFEADRTWIRPADLADVPDMAPKLPLWQRMASVLRRGPIAIPDLAAELEAKLDSVARAVNRSEGRTFARVTASDGKVRNRPRGAKGRMTGHMSADNRTAVRQRTGQTSPSL